MNTTQLGYIFLFFLYGAACIAFGCWGMTNEPIFPMLIIVVCGVFNIGFGIYACFDKW